MINKVAIEAVDLMLQEINESHLRFGGKLMVFGGDFCQVLPVIPKARKEEVINSNLVMSYLWPLHIKIKLFQNMRARFSLAFSKFLLHIGDGKEKFNDDGNIMLPNNIIISYENGTTSLERMIKSVFLNMYDYSNNLHLMINRAILTPKNDYVNEINNILIEQFPGNPIKYIDLMRLKINLNNFFMKIF